MKKKKLVTMVLILTMVVTLILPAGLPVYADGVSLWTDNGNYDTVLYNALSEKTAGNDIHISTPQQLAAVAKAVNDGVETFLGKTVILNNDINLTGHNWEPIGNESDFNTVFRGSFNGNEHSISNMNVSGEYMFAGLFGAIVGQDDEGEPVDIAIVDVTVDGTITLSGDIVGVGGIAGGGGFVDFINCNNGVSISVVSTLTGTDTEIMGAGGILGIGLFSANIMDCTNQSNATINFEASKPKVGGIIGTGFGIVEITILNSVNHGTVIAIDTDGDIDNGAGGIGGFIVGTNVINCYNTGAVSTVGEVNTGGIVGTSSSSLVKNCYSTGVLTIDTDGLKGGIAGRATIPNPEDMSNCSYLDGTAVFTYYDLATSEPVTLTGAAKTTEQMKGATYLDELNTWVSDHSPVNDLALKTWKQEAEVNEGYPSFDSDFVPVTYTVTFDSQGGSVVDVIIVNNNTKITAPAAPTKSGYIFGGWYKESACTNAWDFENDRVTDNTTIYAKWTFDIAAAVATVKGLLEGETYTMSQAAAIDEAAVKAALEAKIATLALDGVVISVTKVLYTPATAGTNGTYTFNVALEKGAVSDATTTLTMTVTATTFSSSRGGGSTSTTQPSQDTVLVIVNGNELDAGKQINSTEDGKLTVIIEVDNKVVESEINEASKNNITGNGNVIKVLIADTESEVAKVELTGDTVKKLEISTFDVSIKRDNIEYIIPAAEFTISKVAMELGVAETDLAAIKIEVKIMKLDEMVVEKYKEIAKANGAELVFPPVSFEVVAKTIKADGTTEEIEISKFNDYVERVMEIPTSVEPGKITTGIIFNLDGTYSHVPTEVFQKDGKWYARINALTNSEYSVIWNPVTVKSVENHWSKDAVNDMASRLVIFNTETFAPDNTITRADFAEYIVRALGLYREGLTYVNKFKDVGEKDERTLAILIATEYDIVNGYPNGTFKPDALITREEAMTMYQRAMKVTKLNGSDTNRYESYSDFTKVSDWAASYVKEVLAAYVFNGTSSTTISPKSNLTYAEAAQAIKNLLVESKLINK